MAKHFVNAVEDIVDDAIEGLLLMQGSAGLARLEAPSGIRVVLRDPVPEDRVALISGGGSGHEPAHAGYVGEGMLTAAVCGDIFASPPVDAVLAAIREVTGPAGCLLIVKNYTGDRLNFGLAAERARAEGLSVEMVLVSDDIALPSAPQPRGLAGTLLVHKIAGAAAESGKDLATVAALARRVAGAIRTISLSLTGCAIPGQDSGDRIAAGKAEFGLGIHGEPGAKTVPIDTVRTMLEPLQTHLVERLAPGDRTVLLINTLGGVPPIEAQVIAQAVLEGPLAAHVAQVIGPAPFMTSLDMRGMSLTILPLDDELSDYLAAPASPPAWMRPSPLEAPRRVSPKARTDTRSYEPSEDAAAKAMLKSACAAIVAMAPDLDALDAKVGDGDTGATFAAGAKDIEARLDALPLAEPSALMAAISDILTARAGGSSGVLLSILLASASQHAENGDPVPVALRKGLERMKELGGASKGDRTMIDALEPALDAMSNGGDLQAGAKAAREGADQTKAISDAKAGRSAYVPSDRLAGVADPGAEGVARLFEALAQDR